MTQHCLVEVTVAFHRESEQVDALTQSRLLCRVDEDTHVSSTQAPYCHVEGSGMLWLLQSHAASYQTVGRKDGRVGQTE